MIATWFRWVGTRSPDQNIRATIQSSQSVHVTLSGMDFAAVQDFFCDVATPSKSEADVHVAIGERRGLDWELWTLQQEERTVFQSPCSVM